MVTTFNKHIRVLVAKWQEDAKGQTHVTTTPCDSIISLTFDIMAEAGFGLESNTKANGDTTVRDAFNVILEETNTRMADAFDWQHYIPWRYFPVKRQQRFVRSLLNKALRERIREKEVNTEPRVHARDLVEVL